MKIENNVRFLHKDKNGPVASGRSDNKKKRK